MLLTKVAPAFQETWKVPRGVAWALPGGPGSARTGPKVTWPPDWSQLRCLARSTRAVAAAGQDLRSNAVSVKGDDGIGCWAAGLSCRAAGAGWTSRRGAATAVIARRMAGRGEATAAAVTTPTEPTATITRVARRREHLRLRARAARSARAPTWLSRLAVACLLVACMSP